MFLAELPALFPGIGVPLFLLKLFPLVQRVHGTVGKHCWAKGKNVWSVCRLKCFVCSALPVVQVSDPHTGNGQGSQAQPLSLALPAGLQWGPAPFIQHISAEAHLQVPKIPVIPLLPKTGNPQGHLGD